MTSKRYFLFFLLPLFIACDDGHMYHESSEAFPQFRWPQDQELTFTPEITTAGQSYRVVLQFRHVHGFQFAELPIKATITSPSGVASTHAYTITLMDGRGDYLASCALDICDLEAVLEPEMAFPETGVYTISLVQDTPADPLPNVMEVGLTIDPAVQ